MTVYEKKLKEIISEEFAGEAGERIIDFLFKAGIIDYTLAKVLVIREYIRRELESGETKLNAMWNATEIFACSYEYVRKCMYYYKDINIGGGASEFVHRPAPA